MPSVLDDLQELLEKNKKLLAGPELDMTELQTWSALRETIFARFSGADLCLLPNEEAIAASLVKKILEADAIIVARFKQQLALLEQKIIATQKIRRILNDNATARSPALLQRVA